MSGNDGETTTTTTTTVTRTTVMVDPSVALALPIEDPRNGANTLTQPLMEPATVQVISEPIIPQAAIAIPPPPQRPQGCCIGYPPLLALTFAAFLLSLSSMAWPIYFRALAIAVVITAFPSVVSACNPRYVSGTVVPLSATAFTAAATTAVMTALTFTDWHVKCDSNENASDRTLQTAWAFDCEWGGIGMGFWAIVACGSVVMWIVVGWIACSNARVFGRLASSRGDRARLGEGGGGCGMSSRLGIAIGLFVSLGIIAAAVIAATHAHRRGTVEGSCPADDPNHSDDFFHPPEINDLGCCTWTAKHGTCCRQQACKDKVDFYGLGIDYATPGEACSDILGLLSCSPCHTDSARYARGFQNITVCESFCRQIYSNCMLGGREGRREDALSFCDLTLSVVVAQDDKQPCFNAAPVRTGSVVALLFAVVAATRI